MKRYASILILVFALIPALTFGQGSKTLKKRNVASQTTYEYFLAEGKKEPVVEKIDKLKLEDDRYKNVIEAIRSYDRRTVYSAIVEFLKR